MFVSPLCFASCVFFFRCLILCCWLHRFRIILLLLFFSTATIFNKQKQAYLRHRIDSFPLRRQCRPSLPRASRPSSLRANRLPLLSSPPTRSLIRVARSAAVTIPDLRQPLPPPGELYDSTAFFLLLSRPSAAATKTFDYRSCCALFV